MSTRKFDIEWTYCTLDFHRRKLCVKMSKPVPGDYENIPMHGIASSFSFNPKCEKMKAKIRHINNKNLKKSSKGEKDH